MQCSRCARCRQYSRMHWACGPLRLQGALALSLDTGTASSSPKMMPARQRAHLNRRTAYLRESVGIWVDEDILSLIHISEPTRPY